MSAIYGIIDKKSGSVDAGLGWKIRDTLIHRATDGSQQQVHDACLFGHCRLNIYPHQQAEQMPLDTPEYLFTANARLHNRDALITALGTGDRYSKLPDTHLVFEAYKKWGRSCLDRLDGEFVFAAWDKQAAELFIAADHIGFKPLFYHDSPEQFIFCSEIKGVEAAKQGENIFDDESLIELFYKKGDPERTYNRSIKALCGGNFLELKNRQLHKTRYWHFQPAGKYRFSKDQDWYDCMRAVFEQAVSSRLNVDVPIGLTLSGGLDSGSVAGMLCTLLKKKNKPLYTFSSVLPPSFDGKEKDEQEYIDALLRKYDNIIPTYVTAEGGSPFRDVERGFHSDDTLPNYFHYMDHALCHAAASKGVKIFYSGFGGDFWASSKGLKVIFYMVKRLELSKAFRYLRDLARMEKTSFYAQLKREVLVHTDIVRWYVKGKIWNPEQIFSRQFAEKFRLWEVTSVGLKMQKHINGGRISRLTGLFENRNESYGMAAATPFFDKALLEFLADMPEDFFVKDGYRRNHIRRAMEGILPREIQWRHSKSAYVIDHRDRFLSEKRNAQHILPRIKSNKILYKYFDAMVCEKLGDKSGIEHNLLVEPMTNRLQQVIISILMIEYLEKNGYKFC